MIFFGPIEASNGLHTCFNILSIGRFQPSHHFIRHFFLFFVQIPDRRSILTFGFAGRCKHSRPLDYQVFVRHLIGVKFDQKSLGVIQNPPIRRMVLCSTRVPNHAPRNPADSLKARLRAPESSAGAEKEFIARSFRLEQELGTVIVAVKSAHCCSLLCWCLLLIVAEVSRIVNHYYYGRDKSTVDRERRL